MNLFKRHGARRLLRLAAILDRADAMHRSNGEPTYDQGAWAHPCGTPACAWGHYAARTPRLKARRRGDVNFIWQSFTPDNNGGVHKHDEFGISREEGWALFSGHGCGNAQTGKQAAKYIRGFVKRKLKELEAA